MSEQKYKPGDIVIWQEGSSFSHYDVWGTVLRVTPKGTVFAQEVGSDRPEKEFRHSRGLRHPSEHELAHRVWYSERPRGKKHAMVYFGFGRSESPQSVDTCQIKSADDCRAAAAELLAIAEWWDREPERTA